jgi:hypothetical protein
MHEKFLPRLLQSRNHGWLFEISKTLFYIGSLFGFGRMKGNHYIFFSLVRSFAYTFLWMVLVV